jgi:hypothetical protein
VWAACEFSLKSAKGNITFINNSNLTKVAGSVPSTNALLDEGKTFTIYSEVLIWERTIQLEMIQI